MRRTSVRLDPAIMRERLRELGWSQSDLALVSEISAQTISNIACGKTCAVRTLTLIAASLGLDPEDLKADY